MSPEAAAINAEFVGALLTQRATVYTRATSGPTNGQYTVVARADLPCLLMAVSANAATSMPDRAALAAMRTLQYDATYTLPDDGVQIEVDTFPGRRWKPERGTQESSYLPGIGVVAASVLVAGA